MTIKQLNYLSKIDSLAIQTAELQVSNTYKVMNLFFKKKLYFIYFTTFKATTKLKS